MKNILACLLLLICSSACAQTITGSNGWSVSGLGGPVEVYKDSDGTVHLQGLAFRFAPSSTFNGSNWMPTSANEIAFTLPVGYRPQYDSWFPIITEYGFGRLLIYATGEVQIACDYTYFVWVSVSGVSFR